MPDVKEWWQRPMKCLRKSIWVELSESDWWLEEAVYAEKEKRPEDASRFFRYAEYYEHWKPGLGEGDYSGVYTILERARTSQVMWFLIPALEWRIMQKEQHA